MPDLQSVSATDPELDPESLPDLERVENSDDEDEEGEDSPDWFSEVASDTGDNGFCR